MRDISAEIEIPKPVKLRDISAEVVAEAEAAQMQPTVTEGPMDQTWPQATLGAVAHGALATGGDIARAAEREALTSMGEAVGFMGQVAPELERIAGEDKKLGVTDVPALWWALTKGYYGAQNKKEREPYINAAMKLAGTTSVGQVGEGLHLVAAEHPEWSPRQVEHAGQLVSDPKALVGNVLHMLPYMAATTAAYMATGPSGAMLVGYAVESQGAYDEAIAAGLSPARAQRIAQVTGTVNAVIEQAQVGGWIKFGKGATGPFKKELSKRVAAKLLAGKAAKLALEEGLEEILQGTSVDLAIWTEGKPPKDFFKKRSIEFLLGSLGGLAMGGASVTMSQLAKAKPTRTGFRELGVDAAQVPQPQREALVEDAKRREAAGQGEVTVTLPKLGAEQPATPIPLENLPPEMRAIIEETAQKPAEGVQKPPADLAFEVRGDAVARGQYDERITAKDKRTGEVLGYIDLSHYEGKGYVKMVEVRPEHRRKGIATALYREAERRAEGPLETFGDYATKEGGAFMEAMRPAPEQAKIAPREAPERVSEPEGTRVPPPAPEAAERPPTAPKSVREFMVDIQAEGEPNPQRTGEILLDSGGAIEVIRGQPDISDIHITAIRAAKKGVKQGAKALNTILRLADKWGLSVSADARQFQAGGLSQSELIAWYSRHGFAANAENPTFLVRPSAPPPAEAAKPSPGRKPLEQPKPAPGKKPGGKAKKKNLVDRLRAKGFDGTIDRLQRGVITEEQAEGELRGEAPQGVSQAGPPNAADYAAELKGRGVGRQESWSRWVQRTALRPGMDAADWYAIYDAVTPEVGPPKKPLERPKPKKAPGRKAAKPAEAPSEQAPPKFGSKEGADAARARLKAKAERQEGPRRRGLRRKGERGALEAFDTQDLKDILEIGTHHFIEGARTFNAWRKKMVDDVGTAIREWLPDLWESIQPSARAYVAAERATGQPLARPKTAILDVTARAAEGEAVEITPNLLLKFAMKQQAKGAKKGYLAGEIATTASHEQLLAFAKEKLPDDEYKMVARVAERIVRQRTPAQRKTIIEAVNRMAENRERATIVAEIQKGLKEANKRATRPEYKARLNELAESFRLHEPKARTLKRYASVLEAAELDDIGEIPQRLIDRAKEVLSEQDKPLLRKLPLGDLRAIQAGIQVALRQNELKNHITLMGKAREAKKALSDVRENIDDWAVKSFELAGPETTDVPRRQNPILRALKNNKVSYVTMVDLLGGREGPLWDAFVEQPELAETEFQAARNEAQATITDAMQKAGVTPERARRMSATLKGRRGKWMRRTRIGHDIDVVEIALPSALSETDERVPVIKMTPAEIIQFVRLWKDPQNRVEILRDDGNGIILRRQDVSVKLKAADARAILEAATDQDKAIADAMFAYDNGPLRDRINATSLHELGIELAPRKDHTSRRREKEQLTHEPNVAMRRFFNAQLEHQGIFKPRTGSRAAVVVDDAFAAFFEHAEKGNAYATKAPVMTNLRRISKDRTVRQTIRKHTKYAEQVIQELENTALEWEGMNVAPQTPLDRTIRGALRLLHRGGLIGRPYIAAYQPVSLMYASIRMPAKYLLSPKNIKTPLGKEVRQWVNDYSPTLWARMSGRGHGILTPGIEAPGIQEFYGVKPGVMERIGMAPIHEADTQAIGRIVRGSVEMHKDMGLKGEELMRRALRFAETVVRDTQPTWDLFSISQFARMARQRPLMKIPVMFTSQPSKNLQMIVSAHNDYLHSPRAVADKARLARPVLLQGIGAVSLATLRYGYWALWGAAVGGLYMLLTGEKPPEEKNKRSALAEIGAQAIGRFIGGTWPVVGSTVGDVVERVRRKVMGMWTSEQPRDNPMNQMVSDALLATEFLSLAAYQWAASEEYKSGRKRGLQKAPYTLYRGVDHAIRSLSLGAGLPLSAGMAHARPIIKLAEEEQAEPKAPGRRFSRPVPPPRPTPPRRPAPQRRPAPGRRP